MSTVTIEPAEFTQVADNQHQQAAAAAGKGVEATESADLGGIFGELYNTHGPISGPSNDAISEKAQVREDAGRAIQLACLTLAAALTTAAAWYTGTDSDAAENLDEQMQS